MPQFGLIGYPLVHSFSKPLFTEKFAKAGLTDYFYELYPLQSIEEFSELLRATPTLRGLNVTMPYKEQVIPYLDGLGESAAVIGAVNTIKIYPDGTKIGHNTDVIGFEKSFMPMLKPHHKKALIFGTGGASKAVRFVLEKIGIDYRLVSRAKHENQFTYEDLRMQDISDYNILINASPVGMTPNETALVDFPYEKINDSYIAYDLIYKPQETLFLKTCKEHGADVQNGLQMLYLQADETWKIWQSDLIGTKIVTP